MITEKTAKSISDLVQIIGEIKATTKIWWYRGQGNSTWQLVPSIARVGTGDTTDREIALIKRFRQNAVAILNQAPTEEFEWLFLMQHHRLPTRLLDWSESPLVALYFAIERTEDATECALWCLDPIQLNKIANIEPPMGDLPAFASEDVLQSYLPSKVAAERHTKLKPVACIGPRNSPRMYAQQGVFTITHREATPLDTHADGNHLVKIIIPAVNRAQVRDELKHLGVNRLSLFPDLDSVAQLAMTVTQ